MNLLTFMICLGIESTAHTFGAAVVKSTGKDSAVILSNEKDAYTTKKGGIIPIKLAEHHVECFGKVIEAALQKANIKLKEIDVISFSQGPGMGHALRVGATAARTIAINNDKPIVGVNHCIAHLEIGRCNTGATDPVLLYASGANTQVIAYEGKRYRIFGETLDMGIGNFLDSFARELGLGFPGGPKIMELASIITDDKKKNNQEHYIELPYTVKGMDVSFGGLLTNLKQKIASGKYSHEELCYSVQETVFAMLVEVSERALAHCEKNELVLGGGVACNSRLVEMCRIMCEERGAKLIVPPRPLLVDNAAMIAWLGILKYSAQKKGDDIKKTEIRPYERTEQIEVMWRD